MTAPALVILAHGSRDPRSAATVHSLVKCLRDMRDDLRIEASFLDHCPPTPYQVIGKLAAEGVEEVVILPLLLSTAFHARVDVPAVVDEARSRFPDAADHRLRRPRVRRVAARRPRSPDAGRAQGRPGA